MRCQIEGTCPTDTIMLMADGFLIGFAKVDLVPSMHRSSDLKSEKFIMHLIKLITTHTQSPICAQVITNSPTIAMELYPHICPGKWALDSVVS